MIEKNLFDLHGIYRDDFRIRGYVFGQGKKSACIVGSMRGNENQQLFACSKLIKRLMELDRNGKISKEHELLVIPCVNPYSMNIGKRFWTVDNTDINRMFPGYSEGETTQRIAGGLFEHIKEYDIGIQFSSFYMPGEYLPHVRMMKTGYENIEMAKQFGMPYVVLHTPRPFDTTTLNYNWQIWETNAFSIYTSNTRKIEKPSANQAVEAILVFLAKQGIISYSGHEGYISKVEETSEMPSVRTNEAGFFESKVNVGDLIFKGQVIAHIHNTYTYEKLEEIKSPVNGIVFFMHDEPMVYANTAVFKLIHADRAEIAKDLMD